MLTSILPVHKGISCFLN